MPKSLFTIMVQNRMNLKGITQKEIAEELDVAPTTVYRWIHQENSSLRFVDYLIDNLDFTYEELREYQEAG